MRRRWHKWCRAMVVCTNQKPAMTELFEMLSNIARRRNGEDVSPFTSLRTVRRWLKNLPADSDYDRHHALVEGLERFNAENVDGSAERMKVLLAIEEAGLPLQLRIVEQYVRNQASFRFARQALWRESWVFWSLLAVAWVSMLKQAYKGRRCAELEASRVEIAVRALRYAGLAMRWDYHQSQVPGASAWRRLHKIYRLVERDGYATTPVSLNARETSCAREYSLTLLLGMTHPLGYRTQEIEAVAQLFESYRELPLPEPEYEAGRHTHAVDLSVNEGAFLLEQDLPTGKRLRYFALSALIEYLQSLDSPASVEDEGGLYRQMANLLSRGGVRRNRQRSHRFGRVWVASGMENILAALSAGEGPRARSALEPWMLRDESTEGMGLVATDASPVPHGRLVAVSWNPAEDMWQLLAVRWSQEEAGQLLVGTQRLSRHPKGVEIRYDADTAEAALQAPTAAVFLPMSSAEMGVSNLLMPESHYRPAAHVILRDGDVVYRLRLGKIHECHEGWVRVSMDVLSRELVAAAA